jgi:DNA primase
LYKKGQVLFGLSDAKQAMRRMGRVIIVEGNLDVVASHKAGVENIVASSGTALTEAQIVLLKRYTMHLCFCFDADAAGFAAAKRGIDRSKSLGCDVSVIVIPAGAGKDPDEVVQKDSGLWREISSAPVPIMSYYFDQAFRGKDLSRVEEKRAIGSFLLPEVARIPDTIEREHWLERLGARLGVDVPALRRALPARGEPVGEAPTRPAVKPASRPFPRLSRRQRAAEFILALFLEAPELRSEIVVRLVPQELPAGPWRDLYQLCLLAYTESEDAAPSLASGVHERLAEGNGMADRLARLSLSGEAILSEISLDDARKQLNDVCAFLSYAAKAEARTGLLHEMKQAEWEGDTERARDLIKKVSLLTSYGTEEKESVHKNQKH